MRNYHIFTGKIESVKIKCSKIEKISKFQTLKHCQNESFQLFVVFSFAKKTAWKNIGNFLQKTTFRGKSRKNPRIAICADSKKWKVTWKNGQFCPKHQFLYFPSKTKYGSPCSQFFGFFTCLGRFLKYMKTGNIEGNFGFGLFKSSGYEQSLKKRWKLAQTQILIFSLKSNIWKHIFSIFHIFTYSGCFSKHSVCPLKSLFFFYPHKSSKIGKSAKLGFREFWVK